MKREEYGPLWFKLTCEVAGRRDPKALANRAKYDDFSDEDKEIITEVMERFLAAAGSLDVVAIREGIEALDWALDIVRMNDQRLEAIDPDYKLLDKSTDARAKLRAGEAMKGLRAMVGSTPSGRPPIIMRIIPGESTPQDTADLLASLADLFRLFGGKGISFSITPVEG